MKKLLILLCAALLLTLLTACGGTSETVGDPTSTPAGTTASPEGTTPSLPDGTTADKPADTQPPVSGGAWPTAALAELTQGKVELPAFTGACGEIQVDETSNGMYITCTDAESADIKAWYQSLGSLGFKDGVFLLSGTVFLKVSYTGDMIRVSRIDEAGKWPFYQMKTDFGFPVDVMGVSDYTFAYDKAAHTVTCTTADADLLDAVVSAFDSSSEWEGTDAENVYSLYQRDDTYPNATAVVTLNGSTLTVVFTIS